MTSENPKWLVQRFDTKLSWVVGTYLISIFLKKINLTILRILLIVPTQKKERKKKTPQIEDG